MNAFVIEPISNSVCASTGVFGRAAPAAAMVRSPPGPSTPTMSPGVPPWTRRSMMRCRESAETSAGRGAWDSPVHAAVRTSIAAASRDRFLVRII